MLCLLVLVHINCLTRGENLKVGKESREKMEKELDRICIFLHQTNHKPRAQHLQTTIKILSHAFNPYGNMHAQLNTLPEMFRDMADFQQDY